LGQKHSRVLAIRSTIECKKYYKHEIFISTRKNSLLKNRPSPTSNPMQLNINELYKDNFGSLLLISIAKFSIDINISYM